MGAWAEDICEMHNFSRYTTGFGKAYGTNVPT